MREGGHCMTLNYISPYTDVVVTLAFAGPFSGPWWPLFFLQCAQAANPITIRHMARCEREENYLRQTHVTMCYSISCDCFRQLVLKQWNIRAPLYCSADRFPIITTRCHILLTTKSLLLVASSTAINPTGSVTICWSHGLPSKIHRIYFWMESGRMRVCFHIYLVSSQI